MVHRRSKPTLSTAKMLSACSTKSAHTASLVTAQGVCVRRHGKRASWPDHLRRVAIAQAMMPAEGGNAAQSGGGGGGGGEAAADRGAEGAAAAEHVMAHTPEDPENRAEAPALRLQGKMRDDEA